ncbi:hypothetical protein B0A49_10562 [Cryomyces minteri]|uniref:Mediator of RNA polymerase II transcription subunit 7 n=1 Tax=Cryomyces minteri TaxID=331657 RepID=A0A4U0W959_9PEZI|nr:hypothetical protein B0A49_10562 [Cryomyces minteri]
MAEEERRTSSAPFPAPPPFYKFFTEENLSRLKELQSTAPKSTSTTASSILDLPPELRYLIPPEPPNNGKYRSFGALIDINETLPSLRSLGIEQLYPSPPTTPTPGAPTSSEQTLDRALYLTKIAKSILLKFLELVGVLSLDPSQFEPEINALQTMFYNAHHLINEYRPHQARESLIVIMEDSIEAKRKEIEGVKEMKARVEETLSKIEEGKNGLTGPSNTERMDRDEPVRGTGGDTKWEQEKIWMALEEEISE